MIVWQAKDAADVRPYGINWAPMLADGDTVATATLTLVQGAVIDSQSNDDTKTIAMISAGVNGRPATFTALLTTTDGFTFEETIYLPIISSACQNYMPSSTTKRTIVEMAFEKAGLPGYSFTASPDEISSAVRALDAFMWQWTVEGINLGYNFPVRIGASDPDEPTLVPDYAVLAIANHLAFEDAPGLGKAMSKEANVSLSRSRIAVQAASKVVPQIRLPRTTPMGSGNQPYATWYPYIADANCCAWPTSPY